jgi:sigma-B regulation protein RsbU (phosphoserine phosphatase)
MCSEGLPDVLDALSRQALFSGLPIDVVEAALRRCPVRALEQGEVILAPGQVNRSLYLLLEGVLDVHLDAVDSPVGFEVGPGECVGEMSVIDGKPASAYVVARGGARVLVVDEDTLWSELIPLRGVARNLLRVLSERMRRRTEMTLRSLRRELEYEHLQKELAAARQIQASMLPDTGPLCEAHPGLDLHGLMVPAREVGGDFYDVFPLEGQRVVFAVGDVVGKGMPAALFMARSMTTLRMQALGGRTVDDLLDRMNGALCENNPGGMFVTVFVGVLDTLSGELVYFNGGHNPPLISRGGAPFEVLPVRRGIVVGALEEARFEPSRLRLDPGDRLLAYTDGVTEAENRDHELFTEERLQGLLADCPSQAAAGVVAAVRDAVAQHAGDALQSDDITLLALAYRPRRPRSG